MKTEKLLRKILLGIIMSVALSLHTYAQESEGGTPLSFNQTNTSRAKISIPVYTTGAIPLERLQAEDAVFDHGNYPFRFGYGFNVSLDLKKEGVMQILPDGTKLWTMQVSCPGALSINFLYSRYKVPAGAKFFIYNKDRSMIIGAFTSFNNTPTGKFGTQLVDGDLVTLEYSEPANPEFSGELVIAKIVHGYRNQASMELTIKAAGSCNVNINCPEAAGWEDQKRAVARLIVDGSGWCTGTLLNNTKQDDKPYFLTANHCLDGLDAVNNPDASGWVFHWNYESATCTGTTGPTNQTTAGATLVANNEESDFALFELRNKPQSSYNVYYAGWDRTNVPANGVVAIHHPATDIKKFSKDNSTLIDHEPSYWKVPSWDIGVTEGGSSGSAIFNFNKRVVGQLLGGSSGCGSSDQSDIYGKIWYSWDRGGSTPQRRLKDWLDPNNTGAVTLDGKYMGTSGGNNSPVVNITAPANNASYNAPASITITAAASDSDGSVTSVSFYNGSTLLGTDATSPYSFTWNNVAAGTYTITARATDNLNATTTSSAVTVIVNTTSNAIATFYQHCNFDLTGYAIGLSVGNYTKAQLENLGIEDDDVSSLKVQSGYEVVLYELDNFQGASQTFTSNVTCLVDNNINDWASSVRVRAVTVNQPPAVSITAPLNNATFTAPATITINANATDDVSVAKVEFYNGSILLGTDNTSPYSFVWNGVGAGTYQLTARATDGAGLTTTSSAITITVNSTVALRNPENPAVTASGLDYSYYEGNWSSLPNFSSLTPIKTGTVANFSLTPRNRNDQFAFQYKGFVNVPADGQYTFYTTSDDGSRLYIGSTMVVDNDLLHGEVEKSGTIGLKAGKHAITVNFFEQGGGETLIVSYAGPGISKQAIPGTALFRIPNVAPVVNITLPSNNAAYTAPATVTINANASDSDGSVTKVEFFNGGIKLGEDFTSPYSFTWNNVAVGTYSITAVATDNANASTKSTAVSIQVNSAPAAIATVYKHCDYSTDGYAVGLNVGSYTQAQLATKGIANNDISSVKIQTGYEILLYNNDNFTGTPLIIRANNSCLVANNFNDLTSSVIVRAVTNQNPVVSITSPTNNASYTDPATNTINASASDDGAIAKVEFFIGSTLIETDYTSPYSVTFLGGPGNFALTARATDDKGATATSAVVTVIVNPANNTCSGIAQYKENGGYVAGSKVQNGGSQYQCKPFPYSGWCNGAAWAYAPGTGAYWSDAWTLVASCKTPKMASSIAKASVAPNPTDGIITISFEDGNMSSVQLVDMYGAEVFKAENVKSGEQLNVSGIPAGIYILKVTGETQTQTSTLIKN